MKILQLIDSLSLGGAERMSVNIANILAKNGIQSYLVASRKSGPLKQFLSPEVAFYELNKKNGLDVHAFYRLAKIVRKIKPDIIHAHSTSVYWAIGIKFITKSTKIVWHDHYGLSDTLIDNERNNLIFFSKWIDGVIAVNTVLENWCRKHLKVSGDKIIYLQNFALLAPMTENHKNDKIILLNLANFRPQKDQLNLLDAVKILKDSGITFELWLAGAYVDKNWLQSVEKKIELLGLTKEVKILGPIENAADILEKASIGILSSISEGLPVSLLEYGLAGLPVICTDTGQCKEVLGNGHYGVVVPPADPKALGNAIIELINQPTVAAELGLAFHKHVLEEYGYKRFLSGYLKLLRTISS